MLTFKNNKNQNVKLQEKSNFVFLSEGSSGRLKMKLFLIIHKTPVP